MTVIEWIAYDDTEKYQSSIGGLGGFFQDGMRWNDFIERFTEEAQVYFEAVRTDVIAKGIRLTGQQHQYADNSVPVFEDNTVGTFSYRAWGDLLAAIWSEYEDKDYCYMDFYC